MSNQLAIRAQTQPGQQLVCHGDAHIHRYEAGAPAALSGVQVSCIVTPDGSMPWFEVEASLNDDDDAHCAPPSLVCFENTHNRCGGRVQNHDALVETSRRCQERGLAVHLDGARLWNASVASGRSLAELASVADSVSVCFSKGLGAPVGSVLCATRDVIHRAHRFRKQFGGGMRQAGILAAACLYAIENHLERLADDHARARRLGEEIQHPEMQLTSDPETNIVLFDVLGSRSSADLVADFQHVGVLASTFGPRRVRFVTHLDVDDQACERAIQSIRSAAQWATGTGEGR